MEKSKDIITHQQLFFMVIQTQLGVGGLSLPYQVFNIAKTDGWISILAAGMVLQIILLFYWLLFKRFESKNILDIAQLVVGKTIGKLISLLYTLYFIAVGSLILVLFYQTIATWILPFTPSWIIGLLMTLAGILLCNDGMRVLARFFTLVTPLILLLVLLISYTLRDSNIYYIFPIGSAGLKNIIFGTKEAVLSMLGFEVLLFIFPLAKGTSKQRLTSAAIAIAFTTILYAYLTVVSYVYFSPEEIKIVPEPLLFILKSYTFKIIERTDLFFLSIWIFLVFTSFGSYLFLSSEAGSRIFKNKRRSKLTYFFAAAIFGLSFLPNINIDFLDSMKMYITNASIGFILFPVLLLLLSIVFKKSATGSERNEKSQ